MFTLCDYSDIQVRGEAAEKEIVKTSEVSEGPEIWSKSGINKHDQVSVYWFD